MNYLSSDCHNFLAEMEQQFPDKIFRLLLGGGRGSVLVEEG